MSDPVIIADHLVKQVSTANDTLTILQDVSLQVSAGESIALVGPSGAGKSTLMTLLAGLDVPSAGEISLLGQPLSQLDEEARAALRCEHISFVFQSFLLIPTLTAIENVMLPYLIQGQDQDVARASQLLEQVGLTGRAHHLPSQLSGGEQQRVALARAFISQPKILFADEPTGNLDQQTASKIVELLFQLNREHGTTLVLVTHDQTLAERCDRTLKIAAGKVAS
ncbi:MULTISPECIES: ABC transporter ATP-binding protein [unclassified Motilimonas]|uniref:ABC transporter ATP-binding protein n=1 Tax=unclassified Motilimonas TaxID=2643697 RepID=UPI001E36C1BB|nr:MULTISPECIES: ABC transporter ATP-binding protein [unclassified Motilimonas]MCE0555937.1 ABC transporter ATP-binding protein [Motilimonas sp. E26]MDO6528051.1 ABC transporter ATP-binding protein [Motilimonas sp. 1_MG-2023]